MAPLVAPLGAPFVVLLGAPFLVILGVRLVVPLGDLLRGPLGAPLGSLRSTLESLSWVRRELTRPGRELVIHGLSFLINKPNGPTPVMDGPGEFHYGIP